MKEIETFDIRGEGNGNEEGLMTCIAACQVCVLGIAITGPAAGAMGSAVAFALLINY